jgi:hypothetical protein
LHFLGYKSPSFALSPIGSQYVSAGSKPLQKPSETQSVPCVPVFTPHFALRCTYVFRRHFAGRSASPGRFSPLLARPQATFPRTRRRDVRIFRLNLAQRSDALMEPRRRSLAHCRGSCFRPIILFFCAKFVSPRPQTVIVRARHVVPVPDLLVPNSVEILAQK